MMGTLDTSIKNVDVASNNAEDILVLKKDNAVNSLAYDGNQDSEVDAPHQSLAMLQETADLIEPGIANKPKKDADCNKEHQRDGAEDYSHLLQDHGWAWLVCFGGFFSHIITGGFERSDGVLFLVFTQKFNQSAQLTAWPGAIVSTIRLVMGPLATAVSNRTSARTSTMIGTFIFAIGLFISGYAPNIIFLFFSYGLIQGIGRGLIYGPGLIMVGLYFNRRRGFGVGLATAGVGIGTFIFPPLVEWLFEHYGFQGAFLILAGLALNTCIVGALFRPLSVHRKIVLGSRSLKTEEEAALPLTTEENIASKTVSRITADLKTSGDSLTKNVNSKTAGCKRKQKNLSLLFQYVKLCFQTCCPVEERKSNAPKSKLIEWSLLRNPSFLFFCFSICLFTAAFKSAFTFLPALAVSKGIDKVQSAYLLSISGILDTIGRIAAGVILDVRFIRPFRPVFYNGVVFVIMGVSFFAPYLSSYTGFAILFGLYGLLTGIYVSQKSVILVDILGEEKLSSSLGLMICFQGVGTFVGPPLSGLLKDIFGRFDEAFYLGGGAMALAGLLMVVSNFYRICRKQCGNEGEVNDIGMQREIVLLADENKPS